MNENSSSVAGPSPSDNGSAVPAVDVSTALTASPAAAPAGPVVDVSTAVKPAPRVSMPASESSLVPPGRPKVRPRLWPAAIFVAIMWMLIKVPVMVEPGSMLNVVGITLGPALGVLGFLVCWLFFSRIPWRDRVLGVVFCGLGCAVVYPLCDESFIWFGMAMYAPPIVVTVWLLSILATPFLPWAVRRGVMVLALALVWSYFPMLVWVQTDGTLIGETRWRFFRSAEELFLAGRKSPQAPQASEKLVLQPGDWPGFRGANRDSRLTGVRIDTDWERHPPRRLWETRIGPGWSSFAVVGKRFYTQYQLGQEEAVGCFDADSGKELWTYKYPGRFFDRQGGLGPRSTPTFHDSKLYVAGARGNLVCLDAATGAKIWQRNVMDDAGASLPRWGYSYSPLVAEGVVIAYGGASGQALLGYDAATGDKKWAVGDGVNSYSSPQPARLRGVDQVLLATELGVASYTPRGELIWKHDFPSGGVVRCVQPGIVDESTLLLGTGMAFGPGTCRVNVSRIEQHWGIEAAWTTKAIRPHYNDLVVHKGHAYGFDSKFFKCIDLASGAERWRDRGQGDGYGSGQVLLLADQDLLLMLSERGEVSLLEAKPANAAQLPGRFQALSDDDQGQKGITWNHPVIAHGRLFVRNAVWMACYELKKD